jgi:hypothetical protein
MGWILSLVFLIATLFSKIPLMDAIPFFMVSAIFGVAGAIETLATVIRKIFTQPKQ